MPRATAATVGIAVVLFALHAWAFRFTQDDAFISLQYARNLVEGHGLVFNVGERVEGYSNFAWTLFLALLLRLGLSAMEIARWTGVLSAALALILAARFAAGVERRWGGAAIGAAILVAASSPLALWSTSGMETAFHTLVVTAALGFAFPERVTPRTRRAAALLFALAAFTRPDAPVLAAAWFAIRALDVRRSRRAAASPAAAPADSPRAVAQDLALYVGPLLPWAVWKIAYYGELIPNTYYAKTGLSLGYVLRGVAEARGYVLAHGAWLAAPALALAASLHATAGGRLLRITGILAAHAVWVVAGAGGDVLPHFRFWLPILPAGCALVAIGAGVAASRAGRFLARVRDAVVVAVALALAILGLVRNWEAMQASRRSMDDAVARALGAWLGGHLAPGEAIAATPIGALAYYSRRPVIDMLGLVDREIARHPEPLPGIEDSWKEKKYNAASVLRRRPGAIYFSTARRPSAPGEQALFLYEDFHRAYFALDVRPDPRFAQPASIYRLRPDAPPPPATLEPVPEREFLDAWREGMLATFTTRDFPRAVAELERAVRTAPSFAVGPLEWWASARYEAGDTTAVPVLEYVLRRDPCALLASSRLSHWYLTRGALDDAERVLLGHVACNPFDARSWLSLAQVSWRRQRYEEGLERIGKSVALWSTNPPAWSLRAQLAGQLGRLDVAEESLAEVVRQVPDAVEARRALERVRAERGR
jgi:tetratricopeptide (TPR) repeat protein